MSGYRIIAVFILIAISYASAHAQIADTSSLRDTIPHLPGKAVEVTAQRPSGLATVDARGAEIRPADGLVREAGSHLVSDALRAMSSSLDIRRYGSLGSVAVPSFRGLPAEYTTVYRDGILLTNEQLGETDLGQLTLHGITRVELIPTSTAILLGGDAIGAAINLENEFVDTASLRIGTEQTGYAHTTGLLGNGYYGSLAVHPTQDLSVVAGGSLDESNGRFPFYQDISHSYVLRENNDATLRSANLNAQYDAGSGTLLKLITNYFSAERGSPGVATTPYRGASYLDERLADEQSLAALKLEHEGDNWHGSIAAHYQNQYEAFRGATEGLGDTATNVLYGLTASANSSLTEWLKGYAGVDYLHSRLLGSGNALPNSSSLIGRDELSGYTAASIIPASALQFTPSVRAQYVSDISDFEILPQAQIEYTPVTDFLVSAAFSREFHAPTLNALYWKGLGNSNLQPERANSGQAVMEYAPNLFGIHPKLGATYFYTLAQNEILWLPPSDGSQNWRPFNVGKAVSKGWELQASGSIALDRRTTLSAEESYTILSTRNITTGDSNNGRELIYSSPTSSLFIASLARDGWGSLAAVAHYRGHLFTDAANTRDGEIPPVTTFDINISTHDFSFNGIGFHFLIGIENLADVNYEEVLEYPMPGRTYTFSIELNYH